MSALPIDEKAIFKVAVCIESAESRDAYLDQVCGDNQELLGRVRNLLQMQDDEPGFLEIPMVECDPTLDVGPVERPGTQIGHYTLLQEIGEGGMGLVYMAHQREPVNRKVALKIIKPGMDTRDVIGRFQAEKQALAMMDHPNIAKVHDAGTTDSGRPYFVMELVNGVPITEYCDDNNLSTNQRLQLFVLVCNAVQHAHQKGIIHRDIKPSNILVTLHDGVPVPKIIDFGIAKAVSQQLTTNTVFTGFGQMIGTPMYMSPEQAERSGLDVDTRSDIYSLGVLLYELLTGTTPFDKEQFREAGLDEMRRLIREQDPDRPSTRISTMGKAATTVSTQRKTDPARLSETLRQELDWIVMKAMEKDRTRRYETATDFVRDIQRYLNDEPVLACPPSSVYRLRKFTRRNRAAVWTMVALILGAGVATGQAFRATKAERFANQQLDIANKQRRLAKEQEQLAKKQKRLAERQRQLAVEMLAISVFPLDPSSVQTGPDGTVFLVFATGQVLRCDAETGRLIDEFANFGRPGQLIRLQRLCFGEDITQDGRPELNLTSGWEGVTRVLDGVNGKLLRTLSTPSVSDVPKLFGRDEIRIGPDGLFYDLRRGAIHRFRSDTLQFVDTYITSTSPAADADTETDSGTFAFGPDGNIYAAFWELHNIQRFDGRTGTLVGEFVAADFDRLNNPRAMAFGPDGHLYVATPKRVIVFDGSEGKLLRELPATEGEEFHCLFFQPSGRLCVSTEDQLLRQNEKAEKLETFIRFNELKNAYLAHRVSEEPILSVALTGSGLQNMLAWSLVWQPGTSSEDANTAIQLAKAAVRNSPENGTYWHTLGAAYFRAGKWEEAQAALTRSDDLCGPTAYVDFFLSMAHWQLGNTDDAGVVYNRGCRLLAGLGTQADHELVRFQRDAAKLMGMTIATEANDE